MSEFTPPSERQLFLEILEQSGLGQDEGVVSFEQSMRTLEKHLQETFLGTTITRDQAAGIEEYENEANHRWMFHDEIATITGKLYLAESEFGELAELDGCEIEYDDKGKFVYVEGFKLRSHGVDIIPEELYDETEEEGTAERLTGIRVGFSFSYADDPHDYPLYTAYPGDLLSHTYATPSATEARRQLQAGWPDVLTLIETLVSSTTGQRLPRRLTMLARRLESVFATDERVRRLAEIYVNDELNLEESLPYVVTVENQLRFLENGDTEDSEWRTATLAGPLTFHAYAPNIRFSSVEDDREVASIYVYVYNESDGEHPEIIELQSYNVTMFRSTKAQRSLSERALQKSYIDNVNDEIGSIREDGDLLVSVEPRKEVQSPRARRVEELRKLEMAYKVAQEVAIEHQAVRYETPEDAVRGVAAVLERLVKGIFHDTSFFDKEIVSVSGENVQFTQTNYDEALTRFANDHDVVVNGIDSKEPLQNLIAGRTIDGAIEKLSYIVIDASSEGNPDFRAVPVYSLLISHQETPLAEYQGMPLDTVIRRRHAVVPLMNDTHVSVRELRQHEEMLERLHALKVSYRGQSLGGILRLERALYHERGDGFTDLRDVSLLHGVEHLRVQLLEKGKGPQALVSTLDQMFSGRNAILGGTILRRVDDNEYVCDEEFALGGWRIADVRDDVCDQLVFVLHRTAEGGDIVRYAPLSGIKSFKF